MARTLRFLFFRIKCVKLKLIVGFHSVLDTLEKPGEGAAILLDLSRVESLCFVVILRPDILWEILFPVTILNLLETILFLDFEPSPVRVILVVPVNGSMSEEQFLVSYLAEGKIAL